MTPGAELARRVELDLLGSCGVGRGAPVVVAFSGGSDSTWLAWCCAELRRHGVVEPHAVHVDHGLRPASADEGRIARQRAESLGLTCEVVAVDLDAGSGLQARARRARYDALLERAGAVGATAVLTGHTLDDQRETLVMRLMRGAGVRGLRGILARTGDGLARPMLSVSREEARKALDAAGVDWLEDPTNEDTRFLRIRVRDTILPGLLARDPSVGPRLDALASASRAAWAAVEPRVAAIPRGGPVAVSTLAALPAFARGAALERWLGVALDRGHVARLIALTAAADAGRPTRCSAPGSHTVHRVGPWLVAGPREGPPDLHWAFSQGGSVA